MSNRIGIYPGTFDPVTIGHMDIVKKALMVVDKLVLGIAIVNFKNTVFSAADRVTMAKEYIKTLPEELQARIEVAYFDGLLVNFAKKIGANLILRGIRAVNDFEFEFQLSCVNSRLMPELQTIFIPSSENNQYVSSRFVKEVAKLGGDISSFSCEFVVNKLTDYYSKQITKEQTFPND